MATVPDGAGSDTNGFDAPGPLRRVAADAGPDPNGMATGRRPGCEFDVAGVERTTGEFLTADPRTIRAVTMFSGSIATPVG